MRCLITILTQVALAVVVSALPTTGANPGDGIYTTNYYQNGTVEIIKLGDLPSLVAQTTGPEHIDRRSLLSKRSADCWTRKALDHSATDEAVGCLKSVMRRGWTQTSTAEFRSAFSCKVRGVKVYYCIDAVSASGNIDPVDIDFALWQMDNNCERYTSSYYRWDGTPEIVGKALDSERTCSHDGWLTGQ